MAFNTIDDIVGATHRKICISKTASATNQRNWTTTHFLAGTPGAGSSPGNTANGLVPTDATDGFPTIPFTTGTTAIQSLNWSIKTWDGMKFLLYDRLFHAGAYSFNSNVSLTSQPSFSSRIVNSSYVGLQIWLEVVTTFTGNLNVTVTYTDQDGSTGVSTGAFALGAAPTAHRMLMMQLAAGDTGVQKIESVVSSTATVGTFNVIIARPLLVFGGFNQYSGSEPFGVLDMMKIGGPIPIFHDSALALAVAPIETTTPVFDVHLNLINN